MMSRKKWEELHNMECDLEQAKIDITFELKRSQDYFIELTQARNKINRLEEENALMREQMKTYKDEVYAEVYAPGGIGFQEAQNSFEQVVNRSPSCCQNTSWTSTVLTVYPELTPISPTPLISPKTESSTTVLPSPQSQSQSPSTSSSPTTIPLFYPKGSRPRRSRSP
jgi:hypothetical protein